MGDRTSVSIVIESDKVDKVLNELYKLGFVLDVKEVSVNPVDENFTVIPGTFPDKDSEEKGSKIDGILEFHNDTQFAKDLDQ